LATSNYIFFSLYFFKVHLMCRIILL